MWIFFKISIKQWHACYFLLLPNIQRNNARWKALRQFEYFYEKQSNFLKMSLFFVSFNDGKFGNGNRKSYTFLILHWGVHTTSFIHWQKISIKVHSKLMNRIYTSYKIDEWFRCDGFFYLYWKKKKKLNFKNNSFFPNLPFVKLFPRKCSKKKIVFSLDSIY